MNRYSDYSGRRFDPFDRVVERMKDAADCQECHRPLSFDGKCVRCDGIKRRSAERTGLAIAYLNGSTPAPTKCGPELAAARELYSVDLPCTCGWSLQYHFTRKHKLTCPGGTRIFEHAPTDDLEPAEVGIVGHVYRGPDSHMYRIARRVKFHNTDGIDYEVEPFGVPEPVETAFGTSLPERKLISSRAIGRTYHHHRSCPCGGGFGP